MTLTIDQQLSGDLHPPRDQGALRRFIRSITFGSPKERTEQWKGNRVMVDLCELVKRYYFSPATNGSNSIKQVLPAVLNESGFLREKYARPIYGRACSIPSLNFDPVAWIKLEGGKALDPHKLLPKLFADVSERDFERLSEDDELRDGGAAMNAYAKLQFEEMSQAEREVIQAGLLRYCELDTLAMVMLYEAWREELR